MDLFKVVQIIIIDKLYKLMNQYEQNLFAINSLGNSLDFEPFRFCDDSNYPFQIKSSNQEKNECLFDYFSSAAKLSQTTKISKEIKKQKSENHFQLTNTTYIDCSPMVKLNVEKTVQGRKDETVQLNINFKTIIVNFFKELMLLNQLSTQQVQLLQDFISRSPSFKSFSQFCKCGSSESNIKGRLLTLIESKEIMFKIMSSRCRFQTKLQMIKFVEVLRRNVVSQNGIIKWKQLLRK